MSICSTHSSSLAPEFDRLAERIQVHHDQVERLDAEFLERGGVFGLAKVGEQPGVHARVQGLDATVEHLGKAGQLLHRCHRNTGARNGFGGRTGRHDRDARVVQTLGEFGEPGLVVDADQRPSDRLAPVARRHPMTAFRPVQVTPLVASAARTSTKQSAFDDLDPLVQGGLVVVVEHRDRLLSQDRPGVGARVHQMHAAAGDLDAVGQCVGHGVCAGKRRQQRGMGVEYPAHEARKKLRPKDFHEARRHDQVRLVRRGGVGDRRVPRVAVGMVAEPNLVAGQRRGRRDVDGPAVAVDADSDDAGRVVADRRLEQGLQQRTGARCQHHDPRRCARGHAEGLLHATSLVVGRSALVADGARRGVVVVDVFEVLRIGQVVVEIGGRGAHDPRGAGRPRDRSSAAAARAQVRVRVLVRVLARARARVLVSGSNAASNSGSGSSSNAGSSSGSSTDSSNGSRRRRRPWPRRYRRHPPAPRGLRRPSEAFARHRLPSRSSGRRSRRTTGTQQARMSSGRRRRGRSCPARRRPRSRAPPSSPRRQPTRSSACPARAAAATAVVRTADRPRRRPRRRRSAARPRSARAAARAPRRAPAARECRRRTP